MHYFRFRYSSAAIIHQNAEQSLSYQAFALFGEFKVISEGHNEG